MKAQSSFLDGAASIAVGASTMGNKILPLATGALAVLCSVAPLSQAQETRPSGTLVAWGAYSFPYVEPGTTFTAIAAGSSHNLALKSDGSVVAWGENTFGQARVPAVARSGVAAIDGAESYSIATKQDGSAVAGGHILPRGLQGLPTNGPVRIPSGLPPLLAIDGGGYQYYFALAIVRGPQLQPSLHIVRNADQTLGLSWTGVGTLEQAESLTAPTWQPAPSQANPQVVPAERLTNFYRLRYNP